MAGTGVAKVNECVGGRGWRGGWRGGWIGVVACAALGAAGVGGVGGVMLGVQIGSRVGAHDGAPVVGQVGAPVGAPVGAQVVASVGDQAGGEGVKMDLGNFSVSLSVKEIGVSRAFYEKLGFAQIGGDAAQGWVIMQSGTTTIGLFQGMFERNMLTFNPGWNHKGERVEGFTDVRELQRALVERGIELRVKADESSTGPASFVIEDPDGNPILFDQHVAKE